MGLKKVLGSDVTTGPAILITFPAKRFAAFFWLTLSLWAGGPADTPNPCTYILKRMDHVQYISNALLCLAQSNRKPSSRIDALMRQVTSTRKMDLTWSSYFSCGISSSTWLPTSHSLSFRNSPRTTMPKFAFPRPSPITQDYFASLLCFLQAKYSAPSSLCLSSWIATAKDEDMESIPRCDHGQLACRLHSIWRSFCTVSDGESSSRQWKISGNG